MKELHIPFGLDRFTGEEIEPEDAVRGRACNCLCPGCGAPLLSRHPQTDEKRIHFAHDSRHPEAKPVEDCPLSPFVSLGMMLRLVASRLTGQLISLPAYDKWIGFPCCSHPGEKRQVFGGSSITIQSCESSPAIEGVTFDLVLRIEDKDYFVDLFYPGKPQKDIPAAVSSRDDVGGVFCIAGVEFFQIIGKAEHRHKRYSDAVISFLLNDSTKIWNYHWQENLVISNTRRLHKCVWNTNSNRSRQYSTYTPRYSTPYTPRTTTFEANPSTSYQEDQERLRREREAADAYRRASGGDDRPSRFASSKHNPDLSPEISKPINSGTIGVSGVPVNNFEMNYECVFCNVKFNTPPNSLPKCPDCKNHLGARRL